MDGPVGAERVAKRLRRSRVPRGGRTMGPRCHRDEPTQDQTRFNARQIAKASAGNSFGSSRARPPASEPTAAAVVVCRNAYGTATKPSHGLCENGPLGSFGPRGCRHAGLYRRWPGHANDPFGARLISGPPKSRLTPSRPHPLTQGLWQKKMASSQKVEVCLLLRPQQGERWPFFQEEQREASGSGKVILDESFGGKAVDKEPSAVNPPHRNPLPPTRRAAHLPHRTGRPAGKSAKAPSRLRARKSDHQTSSSRAHRNVTVVRTSLRHRRSHSLSVRAGRSGIRPWSSRVVRVPLGAVKRQREEIVADAASQGGAHQGRHLGARTRSSSLRVSLGPCAANLDPSS